MTKPPTEKAGGFVVGGGLLGGESFLGLLLELGDRRHDLGGERVAIRRVVQGVRLNRLADDDHVVLSPSPLPRRCAKALDVLCTRHGNRDDRSASLERHIGNPLFGREQFACRRDLALDVGSNDSVILQGGDAHRGCLHCCRCSTVHRNDAEPFEDGPHDRVSKQFGHGQECYVAPVLCNEREQGDGVERRTVARRHDLAPRASQVFTADDRRTHENTRRGGGDQNKPEDPVDHSDPLTMRVGLPPRDMRGCRWLHGTLQCSIGLY